MPCSWQTNTGIIRSISKKGTTDGGKGGVVPLHLVDLYNQATEDRTEQEQEDIANLLAKYSQAFSKHESDLGRTNVPRTVSKQSWIRGKGKASFTVTAFNRR
jgi:hypothetical protein